MGSELRIEVDGLRISVSRVSPEPAAAASGPIQQDSLESSNSSFELVDSAVYSAPASSSPYPLQASGPSSPVPSGASVSLLPSRPQVRSLFSPPQALGAPLQALVAPGVRRRPVQSAEPSAGSGSQALPVLVRSTLSSPLRVPEYPLLGPLRSREEVAESFPALPDSLRDTCRSLRGSGLSWGARAERAWRAGCWARAVLESWAECPDRSEPLGLSNRVYCVLAARGLAEPALLRSFAAYKAIVGDLRKGESLSHAFPSEAEARLYFAGAGIPFPLQ